MAEPTPLYESTSQAGAVVGDEAGWTVPLRFGDVNREYEQARRSTGFFDVSHRAKVELSGPEAASFLQNLCTNDIKNLPVDGGCEFFLTTNKAKVVAHGYAFHVPLKDNRPSLWIDLAPGQAETVINHLDHFLISEQVAIADRSREYGQVHLAGPDAASVLAKALVDGLPRLGDLRHTVGTFGTKATASIRRHDLLGLPGYDIVCLANEAATAWDALLRSGAQPAGMSAYHLLRVEAGTPAFGLDIDENTFAPETGRIAQAICYTKGCYLGQEPIVMARDRGQINRTLLGLNLTEPVPRGSPLFRDGREVGRTTSSVVSPRLGPLALAYIRRGNQEPGTALEVDAAGRRHPAVVAALPFGG